MKNQIEGRVNLEYRCTIDQELRDTFSSLLSEVMAAIGKDGLATLERILVVENERVAQAANDLLSAVQPSAAYVPRPRRPSRAVTLPLEYPDKLICVIVLAQSVIEGLTQEQSAVVDTMSTILEEILHVWLYTLVRGKRGFVQYATQNLASCDHGLFTTAFKLIDEYLVIRRKSGIFMSLSLPSVQSGGECGGIRLLYGGDVVKEVSEGFSALQQVIIQAARGEKEISEAWEDTMTIVCREVFEPLCRYAAYEDPLSEEPWEVTILGSLGVTGDVLAPSWRGIHAWLKRAFSTNVAELEENVEGIVACLREMLMKFGVTYRRLENNACWIDFVARGGQA